MTPTMPELPDYLVPRRGLDMTPRDYADLVTAQVMAIPAEELATLIDRLDTMTLGAPARDVPVIVEEGVSRLDVEPPDAEDAPRTLALVIYRMLLRIRHLALQHDPGNADNQVREMARLWANALAEYERQRHGGE